MGMIDGGIQGDSLLSEKVMGSSGGFSLKVAEATATMSGGTTAIAVNIPVGAMILGTQLRVDTAITSDNATKTWAAAYTGGAAAQSITTGQLFTKNVKVNQMFDPEANSPLVTSAVGTITITAAAGAFTAGVVSAITYYYDFDTLSSL
jgi:hypothetical protein